MNSSIDQQFVEFVVKSIVNNPDAVSVVRSVDDKGVLLELTVDPEDLGRVIGKHGATAQSVRTLLRALGTKNEDRYNLKIVDNGEPKEPKADKPAKAAEPKAATSAPIDDTDDAVMADADVIESEESESERIAKHRADLADFDDLDV